MHNQRILSAQKLDKEIHENVENVSLVAVSNGVDGQNGLRVHNGEPGWNWVYLIDMSQYVPSYATEKAQFELTGMMNSIRIIWSWI